MYPIDELLNSNAIQEARLESRLTGCAVWSCTSRTDMPVAREDVLLRSRTLLYTRWLSIRDLYFVPSPRLGLSVAGTCQEGEYIEQWAV